MVAAIRTQLAAGPQPVYGQRRHTNQTVPSSNVPLGSAAMAQLHAQAQALGTGVGSRRNVLPIQPTVSSSSRTNVPSHSTAQALGTGVVSRGNMLPLCYTLCNTAPEL